MLGSSKSSVNTIRVNQTGQAKKVSFSGFFTVDLILSGEVHRSDRIAHDLRLFNYKEKREREKQRPNEMEKQKRRRH
jgi:hypothetical protein